MYKKVILGLAISALTFGLASFGMSAWALDCIDAEQCPDDAGWVEGSVWAGSPEYSDTEDGVVTTSDDVLIEEVDIEEEEIEEEPAMWPVYLSFGAIGVTFLLVLVINLSARKYNKK